MILRSQITTYGMDFEEEEQRSFYLLTASISWEEIYSDDIFPDIIENEEKQDENDFEILNHYIGYGL